MGPLGSQQLATYEECARRGTIFVAWEEDRAMGLVPGRMYRVRKTVVDDSVEFQFEDVAAL